MIIMKFGGTSVKDADAMKKVLKIISFYKNEKPIIVLSACAGITDKLLELITKAHLNSRQKNNHIIDDICSIHSNIIDKLVKNKILRNQSIEIISEKIIELRRLVEAVKLLKECTERNTAQALAYGELLSSTIFHYFCLSNGLKSEFLDIRNIMKTNSDYLHAKINYQLLKKYSVNIKKLSGKSDFVITQGFISSDSKGITTTLGRGGSDFTASVIGSVIKAKEIQIWTDVSGVLTTDPRLVKSARTIPELSFNEMRELAFYGAKVLHPDTIKPAVENKIPVKILNTYKPKEKGTIIVNDFSTKHTEIHSVILKQNCLECTIQIPPDVDAQRFFTSMIKLLNDNFYKILYSVCTEGNCKIIIENQKDLVNVLKTLFNSQKAVIEKVSVICIAGSDLRFGLTNGKLIQNFLNKISILEPKQIIFGGSAVSVLLLTTPEKTTHTLEKIHSFILNNS